MESNLSRADFARAMMAIAGIAAIGAAGVGGYSTKLITPLVIVCSLVALFARAVIRWRSLVVLIVATILFIPIKRYTLPASLPFQLEPYRVLVGLVGAAWFTALLIDPAVRARRSALDGPLIAYILAIVLSLLMNPHRVSGLSSDVVKSLIFFASFMVVYFLIVSVLQRASDVEFVAKMLVGGGVVLAGLSVVESRTGYNVFQHLSTFFPFLKYTGVAGGLQRGGRLRVVGSAQHPIAFGAALVMMVPLAVYRAQVTRSRAWWVGVFLLILGALATGSRTAITMLVMTAIVYLVFQAREMKKLWPALLPMLLAVHFAIPGTLGETLQAFLPSGGILAQQQNAPVGGARLTTLGPVLHGEVAPDPVFGEGFATRITTPSPTTPVPNAPITDDQWLATTAETGLFGAAAIVWLLVRFFRRMRAAARDDRSTRAPLLVATAASVSSYGIGMFTYDAFSFIQVTFIFYILLALGAAALAVPREQWPPLAPSAA